ncbi:amino acid adenylation domain-containing protein, partial [Pyxidicoccus fallax]|uniref:non-ribosomal peptide synthetase n=1 Tax=Pyxidicoccus fallax TaxID=394095 RepID=UPI001494E9D2
MSDNIEDLYPLSPLQGGMLFHTLAEPGQGLYFNQLVCELRGRLDVDAFIAAWRGTVEAHPVLRTALVWDDVDEPVQVVLREVDLPVRREDWRGLTPEAREAKLAAFVKDDQREGFDLSSAPLVRLALFRTEDAAWRFCFSHSHLMLDGWSLPLLMRDVFALYAASQSGRPGRVDSPRPYRDFIAWLGERDAGQARDFWRRSLAGFSEPTSLTVGGALGAGTGRGERVLRLGGEEAAALEAFTRKRGLTAGTLVQAAWALLLGRYSGTDDVLFGVTVSGRPGELNGVEDMVGLFINTIPVRVRLPPSASVDAWLRELQDWLLEARQHEHTPLVEVRRWSDLPAGTPLFETLVVVENYPVDAALTRAIPGLQVGDIRSVEVDNHPLSLVAVPGRELTLRISHSAERFDVPTVERMLAHLRHLLREMAQGEGRLLGTLSPVDAEERHRLLVQWNDTRLPEASERNIPQVLEAQVARTPDAVALISGQERWTYAELHARVLRLSHHLKSLGVGPESRVGVCIGRSAELVVALMAVQRAGGAYVPLDPHWPTERQALVVRDASPAVLLTTQALAGHLDPSGAVVVCVDAEAERLARLPASASPCPALPDNLCAILYTSGSTGRPKGVALTHRGAVAFLRWATRSFSPQQLSRTLFATSINFDLSVFEMFAPLACGGAVVVADDALALPSLPAAKEVTLVNTVPSAMAELVRARAVPASVSTVNLAGEALPRPLVEALYATGTVRDVFNLYGPTEDTTYSTWARVPPDAEPTIGRPLSDTAVYLLDSRLQPVPLGVAGELYLSGEGLARGYLGRPDLTAERFLPNPFSTTPGARMYRTGDLARYLPDGRIAYVGRADFQVKVRGFRIELGEVEAALAACAGVRESVVLAREDVPGDKRLVAYVSPGPRGPAGEAPAALDTAALRDLLRQRLPAYMVPSAFVVLPALPRTPNGKVDRKALPAPDATQVERTREYVAPRTPTEQLLADLWREVLGVERVGVHDNFFALGGHSLLATRVASRVRGVLNAELPLRALFEVPTLALLAERIEAASRPTGTPRPPLVPVPRTGDLPLSFAQQRLWFLDRLRPDSAVYNLPAAVRLDGDLNVEALERALSELVRRHEVLRSTFHESSTGPVQRVSSEARVMLGRGDLSGMPEAERDVEARRLADAEAQRPFDLERGPPLRASLLKLEARRHVLLLTLHHIVSDGWSTSVLVREVAALYDAFSRGLPSSLPELEVQYADYAVWQRGWLRGEVLEAQVDYWRKQLEGAPRALELPTDRPRPAAQTFRGGFRRQVWPKALWRQVEALSRAEGATPFMVLLAAWQVVLSRYAGQQDVSVGFPIAGRTHAETEGLIGFFVNTLVLRSRVRPEESFRELLGQVREVTLGAYAHQDVPFEKLVEALLPERDLSRGPLFQVSLSLQNTPVTEVKLRDGLTLTGLEADSGTSKFDLSLVVEEVQDGVPALLNYNSDLFEPETADRILEHMRVLLEAAVAEPGEKLWRLPLVSPREQRRLVEEWSGRRVEYPREPSLAELFEARVERTPDAVAVEYEGQRLTYAQLNGRANQLAHHLRRMGV